MKVKYFLQNVNHKEFYIWGLVMMGMSFIAKFVYDSLPGAIVFAIIALLDMIIAIAAKDAQRANK